uniref:SLC12 domain-containing protein n=1 Tax=Steinernema glaseri TaxID=37863 RepID=A0A1I7Z094_9BILA
MDSIPAGFIQAVVQAKRNRRDLPTGLPGIWGKLIDDYMAKRGMLSLVYGPCDDGEWRLHYKMHDWPHIKTRTLTREVARQMSRSIQTISLYGHQRSTAGYTVIDPNSCDHDAILQLLVGLNAPGGTMYLTGNEDNHGAVASKYMEMVSKYKPLLRTFTMVVAGYFRSSWLKSLVNDLLFHGKMEHIAILNPVSQIDSRFWDDFFLSKTCRSFCGDFEHFDDMLAIIRRWRTTDSQQLVPLKMFKGKESRRIEKIRAEDFVDVGMTQLPTEEVLGSETVSNFSTYRIDHLVDPTRFIGITFLGHNLMLSDYVICIL